jgi:hypothetical protein
LFDFVFIGMSDFEFDLPKDYSGEDKTVDYTDSLKKIWDSKIPNKVESVISFDTIKAIFNEHKKTVGPYHMWEDKLFFRAKATLPIQPLRDNGFVEGEKITSELFKKSFGEIDLQLRQKMIGLARYMGLELSQFDLDGIITYFFKDESTPETIKIN